MLFKIYDVIEEKLLPSTVTEYCLKHIVAISKYSQDKGLLIYLLANCSVACFLDPQIERSVFVTEYTGKLDWSIINAGRYIQEAYTNILGLAHFNGGSHPVCMLIPEMMFFSAFCGSEKGRIIQAHTLYRCDYRKAENEVEKMGCICSCLCLPYMSDDEKESLKKELIYLIQSSTQDKITKRMLGMALECKWIQPNLQWALCQIGPVVLNMPHGNKETESLVNIIKSVSQELAGKLQVNWEGIS